jgi:hypothetical protein
MRDEGGGLCARHASALASAFRLSTFALLLAACAASNPKIEAAKRVVDRAEPLRCDIVALEQRLAGAAPGESTRLGAELDGAKAKLKYHYMATMDEYIHVMKQISYEERQEVRRYADDVAQRCSESRK